MIIVREIAGKNDRISYRMQKKADDVVNLIVRVKRRMASIMS